MKTKKYFFIASLICTLCATVALRPVTANAEKETKQAVVTSSAKSDSPKAEKKGCCPFKKCCKKEEAKKAETSKK